MLEALGAIMCMGGAFLAGSRERHWRGWGFVLLLLAAIVLAIWAVTIGAWWVAGMNCFFMYTSYRGLSNVRKSE
jgi:uncharacterized ion transporter superfamily protein YfcC